ncbi:hypothetical protein AVEN_88565-1 [Araneus ventricosus]|uniref:Uncharacterized protein n=1 Tax=Araneus ventricosus TaxID=182803 RepID=A0A4Y2PI45_ARAVE|nr:hypothetical protein AVEN_88565-1 [Araneus ventricosus]
MQKEEYEEWMSIDEDIPVSVTLADLEICQAVCERDQAVKVDNSDGDECVEENPPTNAEMRQALDILKRCEQHRSTSGATRAIRVYLIVESTVHLARRKVKDSAAQRKTAFTLRQSLGAVGGHVKGRKIRVLRAHRALVMQDKQL